MPDQSHTLYTRTQLVHVFATSLALSLLSEQSQVLLANFNLSADRKGLDVAAMGGFICAALCATFAVLHRSKFRR